jgi:hypothetical protein
LVVIGPSWATASTPEGRLRLFEPDDYVRRELASVLSRDLPVAPVLVGGASLPALADLPDDLQPLLRRQAIVVRDETWHQDVDSLLRSLRGESFAAPRTHGRRVIVTICAVVLAAIIGIISWRPWADEGGSASASVPSCPDTSGAGWTSLTLGAGLSGRVQQSDGDLVFTVRRAVWRPIASGGWQVIVETDMANRTTGTWGHHQHRYDSILVSERRFEQSCFDTTQSEVVPNTIGPGRTGYVVSCDPTGVVALLLADGHPTIPVADATGPSRC